MIHIESKTAPRRGKIACSAFTTTSLHIGKRCGSLHPRIVAHIPYNGSDLCTGKIIIEYLNLNPIGFVGYFIDNSRTHFTVARDTSTVENTTKCAPFILRSRQNMIREGFQAWTSY